MVQVCLVFATICVLVGEVSSQGMTPVEDEFIASTTTRFSDLSATDMVEAWHTECHRRCGYQFNWQIELACTFDPYRIEHRRRRSLGVQKTKNIIINRNATASNQRNEATVSQSTDTMLPPFMTRNSAVSFLTNPKAKRTKRGIMEECCITKACSWEEYGEYCQRHPRGPRSRDNFCMYN